MRRRFTNGMRMKLRTAALGWAMLTTVALGAAAAQGQTPATKHWTLAKLEALARQHNPTLRQALERKRAAAGEARQAGMWPNPKLGYQGDEIRGGSFGGGEQGIFAQQTIVLGGKLAAGERAAAARVRERQIAIVAQRQAIETAVQLAFYRELAAERMVSVEQSLAANAGDALQTTRQLFNVGQADLPDELEAQVEAGKAELRLDQARRREAQRWAELSAMVGLPALERYPLAGRLAAGPATIEPQAYLQKLLNQSPAVQLAEAQQLRARAVLMRERKQTLPNLTLRGGVQTDRELNFPENHPVGWVGFAQASVGIPLFNRNQGNVASAAADVARARLEMERVRLALRQAAARDIETYQNAAHTAYEYRMALLPQARQAYRLYLANYRKMAAAYPEVVVAQRAWYGLEASYVSALRRWWISAIRLRGFMLTRGLGAMPDGSGGQGGNRYGNEPY